MNHKTALTILAVLLLPASLSSGQAKPAMNLAGANWIWFAGEKGNPAASAPRCTRYFRKSFDLPGDAKKASARAIISADNFFRLTGAAQGN